MDLAVQIPDEEIIVSTTQELCEQASAVLILSKQDVSEATDLVKVIKSRHKEIEGERVALVKPLNDTVARINARFKAIIDPLKSAEDEVKGKMLAFSQEENRKAVAARQAAEAAARAEAERLAALNPQEPPSAIAPISAPAPVNQSTYGQTGAVSTIKKVWVYEVTDIQALAAARPDLVVVDAGKINAEIRGKGGEIPGLRIYEKETVAIR